MKIIIYSFIFIIISSCSQLHKNGNIKWVKKFSFLNLNEKDVNDNPPSVGLKLLIFKFLNEKTVFIAGSKDLQNFGTLHGNSGVLFVSKNKGQTFKEIIFPEEGVKSIHLSNKFSLIETNSDGYSPKGKNCIYLLNNKTLHYQKVDEYSSISKIHYTQFKGNYAIYTNDNQIYLLNVFTKEKYKLPDDVTDNTYILSEKGLELTFLKDGNTIVQYNPLSKTYKTIKKLHHTYSTIMKTFGGLNLVKANLLKTAGTVYDLDENKLFSINPKEEKGLYRYKNFACRLVQTRPYVTIQYSYDYGGNWMEYVTQDFFTSSIQKGFYKDKYILSDVVFYSKDNYIDIMIGEFQK